MYVHRNLSMKEEDSMKNFFPGLLLQCLLPI